MMLMFIGIDWVCYFLWRVCWVVYNICDWMKHMFEYFDTQPSFRVYYIIILLFPSTFWSRKIVRDAKIKVICCKKWFTSSSAIQIWDIVPFVRVSTENIIAILNIKHIISLISMFPFILSHKWRLVHLILIFIKLCYIIHKFLKKRILLRFQWILIMYSRFKRLHLTNLNINPNKVIKHLLELLYCIWSLSRMLIRRSGSRWYIRIIWSEEKLLLKWVIAWWLLKKWLCLLSDILLWLTLRYWRGLWAWLTVVLDWLHIVYVRCWLWSLFTFLCWLYVFFSFIRIFFLFSIFGLFIAFL